MLPGIVQKSSNVGSPESGGLGELGGLVGGRAQPRHLRFPKSLRIWGSLSFAFRSMAVGIYPPVQSGPILLR